MPTGDPPRGGDALGQHVGEPAHQLDLRVQHLVDGDEVGAHYVPVHVLEREVQVVARREPLLELSASVAESAVDSPGTVNSGMPPTVMRSGGQSRLEWSGRRGPSEGFRSWVTGGRFRPSRLARAWQGGRARRRRRGGGPSGRSLRPARAYRSARRPGAVLHAPRHRLRAGGHAAQALRNAARAIEGAAATLADVRRMTVYVTQWQPEKICEFMAGVEAVAPEIGLSLPMPPASLIGVQMLFAPEVLVEIEATAVLD